MLPVTAQETHVILAETPTLARWANAFLQAKKAERKTAGTLGFYKDKLLEFVDYCAVRNVSTIDAVDATLIREFLLHLEEHGHNSGGLKCFFQVVRCFFKWYESELDDPAFRNPIRKVKAPKVETPLLPPVPIANVEAMCKTCADDWRGARDKGIMLTLFDTGLRASELLFIDLEDVDPTNGEIKVRHAKNGEARLAWLGQRARRAMRAYLKYRGGAPGGLFIAKGSERLRYEGLRKILETRAKLAGLEKVYRPHAFRRGAAISLLRNGADLLTVSRLLGHKTLEMTKRYLKQTGDVLHAAHAANSPVDRAGL